MKQKKYKDPRFLEQLFINIKNGYTCFLDQHKDKIYFKHYSIKELDVINNIYNQYYTKAVGSGLITLKDLKSRLDSEGVWTQKEEDGLTKLQEEAKSLNQTIKNLFLDKDKKPIQSRLDSVNLKIKKINKVKNKLFDNYAERYAERQSEQKLIRYLVYKDKKLKKLKYSEQEYEELDIETLSFITHKQKEVSESCNDENIRQLSISAPFISLYNIFDKDLSNFFEQKPTKLSFYQINLLNYAKLFASIFENKEIPQEISKDAAKILKHIEEEESKKKHVKNAEQKSSNADGFSFAGAKREDLEKLGINTKGAKDIHKIAEEKGGELSMEDFMKIHNK